MPRLVRMAFVAGTWLVACAAGFIPLHRPSDDGPVRVIADVPTQALFDSAIIWSRAHNAETGGCFSVFVRGDSLELITDGRESAFEHQPKSVVLHCNASEGLWHTHFPPVPDSVSMGCHPSDVDIHIRPSDHPFGVVVCGVGRDSDVAFFFVPDTLHPR